MLENVFSFLKKRLLKFVFLKKTCSFLFVKRSSFFVKNEYLLLSIEDTSSHEDFLLFDLNRKFSHELPNNTLYEVLTSLKNIVVFRITGVIKLFSCMRDKDKLESYVLKKSYLNCS